MNIEKRHPASIEKARQPTPERRKARTVSTFDLPGHKRLAGEVHVLEPAFEGPIGLHIGIEIERARKNLGSEEREDREKDPVPGDTRVCVRRDREGEGDLEPQKLQVFPHPGLLPRGVRPPPRRSPGRSKKTGGRQGGPSASRGSARCGAGGKAGAPWRSPRRLRARRAR